MAKEGLFNVLKHMVDFEELHVLDLFAGTGSISFEFASRGAVSVTSIDINFRCVDFIKKTAREIGIDSIKVARADVFRYLSKSVPGRYDLIFADAPFDLKEVVQLPELIMDTGWLKKNARLIIEHPANVDFTGHKYFIEKRNYGKVQFSFFEQQ